MSLPEPLLERYRRRQAPDRRGRAPNDSHDAEARGSFTFEQGAGPCPPGSTCRWTWTVTPEGAVVTDKQGVLGTATLSDADLLEVDALLRSDDLLRAMVQGPFCDPPPTDVSVSFILDAGGPSPLEQDVTGCAFAAAEQEPFARLWNIVRTY